jgi:hypothetical protein
MKWLPLLMLVAACAGSPYHGAPHYAPPQSRAQAARHLTEALAFHGINASQVDCDDEHLRWLEVRGLTPTRAVTLNRELRLASVRPVDRPARGAGGWQLHVPAEGGDLTFVFTSSEAAAAAQGALNRLRKP